MFNLIQECIALEIRKCIFLLFYLCVMVGEFVCLSLYTERDLKMTVRYRDGR